MKRSIYSAPDNFSISPYLSLLPSQGSIGCLEQISNSIFARLESVQVAKRNMQLTGDNSGMRGLQAEETMLKHVLDWLAMSTEGKK
jgi:hypothetical protein